MSQQAESYHCRFNSNNQADIDHMLSKLENYPTYVLHSQREKQLNKIGLIYSKVLNMLKVKHDQLKIKKQNLIEILKKLHIDNNPPTETVYKIYNIRQKKKLY